MFEEEWPPPPPNEDRNAIECSMRVDEVGDELAECHGDVALHLSLALSALQSAIDRPYVTLRRVERECMLQGLANAHAFARLMLVDLDRELLHRGVEAATGQILYLAADDVGRRSWSADSLARLAAAARILRDNLHSRSLLAELQTIEARFATGELPDEIFERSVRAKHARIATNRINVARLERYLSKEPPRTRPQFRLVG